jgi:hypothetical protein
VATSTPDIYSDEGAILYNEHVNAKRNAATSRQKTAAGFMNDSFL